ncbi:MAG TPA: ABC transporter permease [Candidatus Limnocylindrales bacterium]
MGSSGQSLMEVIGWFTDPANWSGTSGIPNRMLEHLVLAGLAILIGCLIAIPVGLFIGHTGKGAGAAVAIGNLGRAIPSYALLVIFVPLLGIGFFNALAALVLLSLPPILTNTYAGLQGVDRDLVEAGRGMGMRERQILRGVELPLALPVILAGVRIASVQVVATATLAALVAGGALGRFIVDGFAQQNTPMLVGGAILVALLAILTERFMTILEHRATSPGLRAVLDAGSERPAEVAAPTPS